MDARRVPLIESADFVDAKRSLVGIVTKPAKPTGAPTVLLLGAGLRHRVGPNRLYVNLARALAIHGAPVCRFDFSGIGDSPARPESGPHEQRSTFETRAVMDHLLDLGLGPHFVLGGVSSGGDVAWATACQDERATGVFGVNALLATGALRARAYVSSQSRSTLRFYREKLTRPASWRRLLTGKSQLGRGALRLGRSLRPTATEQGDELADSGWPLLLARGTRILQVYSRGSAAFDMYSVVARRLGALVRHDHVSTAIVPDADHSFTPSAAQSLLAELVIRWVGGLVPPPG